jgi:hypothetical protein
MSEPLNLGDSTISAASADATGSVITSGVDGVGYLSGLGDYLSANLEINFTYGSGGTTLKVVIETTFNQGTTWVEVYRAAFALASAERVVNVSALTPLTSPLTPAALSDDTVKDGVFGDRWRARKIVAGTYAGNSSVSVRMQPRGG